MAKILKLFAFKLNFLNIFFYEIFTKTAFINKVGIILTFGFH